MLELINEERESAGLNPVGLGDNRAAQLHAESSFENCFASHWGLDGLKPYMRYSLAGGFQSNGENGHGTSYCITESDGYRQNRDIQTEVRDAMAGWMDSSGHRRNILDPTHKQVNIGLAWDRFNFVAIQHFEGDYVRYDTTPVIEDGVLKLKGTLRNGATAKALSGLGVQIYYDPSPQPLTRAQVARTYCYDGGRLIASLREPLQPGWFWDEHEFSLEYEPCPDPYAIAADAPPPTSHDEAHQFWQDAYDASQSQSTASIVVPWLTADEWRVRPEVFYVKADLESLLQEHGAGVYTILVWATVDGEDSPVSQYSVFYELSPPGTYD